MKRSERKAHSRRASHGSKMVVLTVRFWTDRIVEDGMILPGHARTSGVVRMERNSSHGIEPREPKVFNSLMDLNAVIEKVLIEHGVVLHPSDRMRKYVGSV